MRQEFILPRSVSVPLGKEIKEGKPLLRKASQLPSQLRPHGEPGGHPTKRSESQRDPLYDLTHVESKQAKLRETEDRKAVSGAGEGGGDGRCRSKGTSLK